MNGGPSACSSRGKEEWLQSFSSFVIFLVLIRLPRGWQHYAIHRPEPHILLFRRPLGTDPQTGAVDPELKRMALEEYKGQFGLKGN